MPEVILQITESVCDVHEAFRFLYFPSTRLESYATSLSGMRLENRSSLEACTLIHPCIMNFPGFENCKVAWGLKICAAVMDWFPARCNAKAYWNYPMYKVTIFSKWLSKATIFWHQWSTSIAVYMQSRLNLSWMDNISAFYLFVAQWVFYKVVHSVALWRGSGCGLNQVV